MPSLTSWKVPPAAQPRAEDFCFDLHQILRSVVGLHAIVPADAFTAETLGTERSGNGVVIDDGLVLTIGYLITEAETVWLHLGDGRVVEGHALGIDPDTGFGLVQALGPLDLPAVPLGSSAAARPGDRVLIGGVGGAEHSVAAYIVAKQEFSGYWEYLLDEAIFTTPSHPNWGGTALISERGELIGIGSLQIEREQSEQDDNVEIEHLNMMVPIDLLKPILADLKSAGRVRKAARPWLGLYAAEIDDQVVVVGVTPRAPAARAELKPGDLILAINGHQVDNCADFYRRLWALGPAGVTVPLTLYRGGDTFDVELVSSDRFKPLKKPRLH
ncbi:S1C family serine protease [Rhodopseudomonas pseudopalustris]|uniref:S1C family serine protease n=1 Tax=Rhodopseudomonas pseudopalustris TaxID=1513892 RepID=UPI000C9F6B3C